MKETPAEEVRAVNGKKRRTNRKRGAFTLVEVLIAAVVAAFVLGSLSVTMAQLGRLKNTTKLRLDAHLRAEAAISAIRRDLISVVRHDDLFWTRLLIRQGNAMTPIGELARDEVLVFNTRLSAIQDLDFHGEGMQYETQYRIDEDYHGAMLWQRRDAVPDEFYLAGGVATPLVEGIVGMKIEAYDGYEWTSDWDSDERGLPLAVRVTVGASGSRNGEDLYDAPIVQLRAVVPIDRVIPPSDLFRPTDEELAEMIAEAEAEDITEQPSRMMDGDDRGGGAPGFGTQRSGRGARGARGGSGGRGGQGTGAAPRSGGAPSQHQNISNQP